MGETPETGDEPMSGPMLRTMQVIIAAMTSGLVVASAAVLFLRSQPRPAVNPPAGEGTPAISYAAVALAAAAAPMSLLIPTLVVKRGREQVARAKKGTPVPDGTTSLAAVYQTALIIGAALNEGPAFFVLIAYLLEGQPWTLAVAALLILGVASRFPTRARVDRWIDTQKELMTWG